MVLSKEDGKLFYLLMLPLLDYVNVKYEINKRLENKIHRNYGFYNEEIKEIQEYLWDDVSIIDEYISINEFSEEHKQILLSWKRCVREHFVLERHLKAGSIFIAVEDNTVYQVSGIVSTWQEMTGYSDSPVLLEAALIPFKDVIISDGIISPVPYPFSVKDIRNLNKVYQEAKNNNQIIQTL